MKYFYIILVAAIPLFSGGLQASDKIKVVTTLPDLRTIVEQIGGDKVTAHAIARGYQDPHFVDAKPSFVLKLKQAELFAQIGLDLEIGWVPPLLETARNKKIYFGGSGYVDASKGIELLEIPTTDAAQLRSEGDIHIYGNPHYWLDPRNGKIIAKNMYEALSAAKPEFEALFRRNLEAFNARIDSAYTVWTQTIAPFKGSKIIAYHNSWPYFEKAFGIEIVDFIEPKPGIPPTPSHLISIIKRMKQENIKAIIISPYYDGKPARSVAKRSNAVVVEFAPSVGAFAEINTYFDLFNYNIKALTRALNK